MEQVLSDGKSNAAPRATAAAKVWEIVNRARELGDIETAWPNWGASPAPGAVRPSASGSGHLSPTRARETAGKPERRLWRGEEFRPTDIAAIKASGIICVEVHGLMDYRTTFDCSERGFLKEFFRRPTAWTAWFSTDMIHTSTTTSHPA